MQKYFLSFFLCLFSLTANGYEFDDFTIIIPSGFEGPIKQSLGPETDAIAFSKPHGDDGAGTLLQLTIWNSGQEFPPLSKQELEEGSAQYLLQFLSGIERARDTFSTSEVEYLSIAGIPAAKINWEGSAMGKEMHGTMYCLIYNSKIFSFHTQDFKQYNEQYSEMAENSFENIEKRDNK